MNCTQLKKVSLLTQSKDIFPSSTFHGSDQNSPGLQVLIVLGHLRVRNIGRKGEKIERYLIVIV